MSVVSGFCWSQVVRWWLPLLYRTWHTIWVHMSSLPAQRESRGANDRNSAIVAMDCKWFNREEEEVGFCGQSHVVDEGKKLPKFIYPCRSHACHRGQTDRDIGALQSIHTEKLDNNKNSPLCRWDSTWWSGLVLPQLQFQSLGPLLTCTHEEAREGGREEKRHEESEAGGKALCTYSPTVSQHAAGQIINIAIALLYVHDTHILIVNASQADWTELFKHFSKSALYLVMNNIVLICNCVRG